MLGSDEDGSPEVAYEAWLVTVNAELGINLAEVSSMAPLADFVDSMEVLEILLYADECGLHPLANSEVVFVTFGDLIEAVQGTHR